jgi:hypothetical protein
MSPHRVYRSKVDGPIALVAALSLVVLLYVGSSLPGPHHGLGLIIHVVGFCGLGFCVWTLLGTYYTLDATTLTAHSGPFNWAVPLREIRSVEPTRDPRSGPALSFDRLRIEFGPGRVLMISPREKDEFLAELTRRGVQGVRP